MEIVTEILGNLASLKDQAEQSQRIEAIDRLVLTSEERLSPHLLGHTVGGRRIRISLPRTAELFDGDVLAIDDDVAIVVEAAAEDLLMISPDDKLTWGIVGFQLGNLHRPVRFTEAAILTPADAIVAELLGRLGVAFEQRLTAFVGYRYAQTVPHTHAHTHAHTH